MKASKAWSLPSARKAAAFAALVALSSSMSFSDLFGKRPSNGSAFAEASRHRINLVAGRYRHERVSSIARGNDFAWHARDPTGTRHIETRQQAMRASTLKSSLESIFVRGAVQLCRVGDEEMQQRIRIDDVIMSRGCKSAYVHVSAMGDRLEQRQVFVWLQKNKGRVNSALAKMYWRKVRLPQIFFVESQMDRWDEMFRKARKYPELNLPDPYQADPNWIPKEMRMMQESSPVKRFQRQRAREGKVMDRAGMGDETKPFPKWGYPSAR